MNLHWHPEAIIEAPIPKTVVVWEGTRIRQDAIVCANTKIGRHVYIDTGVRIGENCKIQNGAQIYGPCLIGHGVFVGPNAMVINDRNPRAVNEDGSLKERDDWLVDEKVFIDDGASIGAGAIIFPGVRIGKRAMVGAGVVVRSDVLDGQTFTG